MSGIEPEEVPLREDFEKTFKPIFDEYEESGGIPLRLLRDRLQRGGVAELVPGATMDELLRRADKDGDKHLSYKEFIGLVTSSKTPLLTPVQLTRFQRAVRGAVSSVVPRHTRTTGGALVVDDYLEHYTCKPPPLFIIGISLIEVGIFIYYSLEKSVTATSGAPLYGPFPYNPYRRHEAWRFLTYMFIHQGYTHLIFNLIFQLAIGIPLEMVHKWWRVGIVYSLGVIAGCMSSSVFDSSTFLVGASGGCYALIGAHFAIIIMNWKEMTHDWMSGIVKTMCSAPVRLLIWSLFAGLDFGIAIWNRYRSADGPSISYAAHLGGALAGLLVGIPVLKNIAVTSWERVVRWVALAAYLAAVTFAVLWNIFYPHFPRADKRPCCPAPY